jgi:hypothetical protein
VRYSHRIRRTRRSRQHQSHVGVQPQVQAPLHSQLMSAGSKQLNSAGG